MACLLIQAQAFSQSLSSTNPLLQLDLNSGYETQTFLQFNRSSTREILSLLLAVSPEAEQTIENEIQQNLDDLVSLLKKKQAAYNNEEKFLRYMYYKIHRKYLKHYTHYPDFLSLFNAGQYDCVTGTALYAYLLDTLGYDYTIKELAYHIYLLVEPQNNPKQTYLIESTDPIYGFVSEKQAIEKRVNMYKDEESSANSGYQYNFKINNTINLEKLAGLAYYNSAVTYYNQQQFAKAIAQLKKANYLYHSQRMEAFRHLIDQTLTEMPQSKLID